MQMQINPGFGVTQWTGEVGDFVVGVLFGELCVVMVRHNLLFHSLCFEEWLVVDAAGVSGWGRKSWIVRVVCVDQHEQVEDHALVEGPFSERITVSAKK
jgi:hypothetical protein